MKGRICYYFAIICVEYRHFTFLNCSVKNTCHEYNLVESVPYANVWAINNQYQFLHCYIFIVKSQDWLTWFCTNFVLVICNICSVYSAYSSSVADTFCLPRNTAISSRVETSACLEKGKSFWRAFCEKVRCWYFEGRRFWFCCFFAVCAFIRF